MSSSKRHFTAVIGKKEQGLYVSSTPSSAARKAVSKLCADDKKKKIDFYIRETTQGSKKKVYGMYTGYMEKLKEPIELKGRVIKYKPVAKLSKKKVGGYKRMSGGSFTLYFYQYFPAPQEKRGQSMVEKLKQKLQQYNPEYNPEDRKYYNIKNYSKKFLINPVGISIASNIDNFEVINAAIKEALRELNITMEVEEEIVEE